METAIRNHRRTTATALVSTVLTASAMLLVPRAAAEPKVTPPPSTGDSSLYRGPAPRPGPDVLYAPPAKAPQLTNTGPWRAEPILISGASAYRDGEFLYQDYLYDDHGARAAGRDPQDPRVGSDDFSAPNGTYTYPTDPVYANNAADLVELRVQPLADATAFRITLNTMKDPALVATTIAIGDSPRPHEFPHGANASAPAELFLTVHGSQADLLDAETKQLVGHPRVRVDERRRQIEVRVPHSDWNPGLGRVRLAAGVGLWDPETGRYLVPKVSADAEHPGGAAGLSEPTAFFNVAFRYSEPMPGGTKVASPAWWRDRAQGEALRTGDLSRFSTVVDFAKLNAGVDDDMPGRPRGVPQSGPMNRILASHVETKQGVDYSTECGNPDSCLGQYRGQLQPYAIYVPKNKPDSGRYGLTLLLHSLSANYNQYLGNRNQSQFGERGSGSIVITPEARGPDGWYYHHAAADVFDVWADVAAHYPLDPDYTAIAGYSMGGYGTYKLAARYPDLFARAQPTVGPPGLGVWAPPAPPTGGTKTNTYRQLASLRHVPFLMWVASGDELVPLSGTQKQARRFDELGYRYIFDTFSPATHLTLSVNDQYRPAAEFLGTATVKRDPAHITYVVNPTMDFPGVGTVADHAYWLSGLRLRDGSGPAPLGTIDVRSKGFGVGDPEPSGTRFGGGLLTGGDLPALAYTRQYQTWGPVPRTEPANALVIEADNIGHVTVHPGRARVGCDAKLSVDSDGPITVTLAGCGRTEHFAG